MRVFLAIPLLALLLTSCASNLNVWATVVPMGEHRYAPVQAERVMILFETPTRSHAQIGTVSTIGGAFATDSDMFLRMQREAAKIGADAIIIQARAQPAAGVYPKINGIIIRYQEQPLPPASARKDLV